MATRKQSAASGSSAGVTPEAVDRPSTPPLNYGAADHSFTLQAIMELQKSVGEMNATMMAMKSSMDSTKGKVDDLVGWKNMILGGALAIGAVLTLLGFIIGKGWDYVTIKTPTPPSATVVQTAPAQPVATPASVPASKAKNP